MAIVTIRDLNKKYENGFHAVKDVNLEIRDKEFMVLVGPSGCGKTTTLRMVAGLEEITSGEIRIGERVVNDLPPMDRDIAMVFQNYALYPHKTVFDNMAFGLQMRKYPKDEVLKRVRDAADILGIEALLERKPRQLSGGQRQRVAVGRAIVRHPQVFLFDEPLSNLDAKLRVQMRVELKRLHERLETTAIYVTHDQVEAMTLGTRVVVMKDGYVQQVGEPLVLYGQPANKFVAGFIGSPAMNFVDVSISGDGRHAETEGLRLNVPDRIRAHGGKRLTLGVRPEALRIANGSDEHGFATKVDVVEPLGNEILLNFRAGGAPMVARVDPGVRLKAHESVRFAVDPERLHFFDATSEAAL
ncbi:glycerol-3-phosphate ABC transporter ATP-binding protein [Betaproteobacteria bacterium SCGC AG-212-J23]|nr:glycerol-3-phosphate ABC transporter ATP-binding protein [Betaproteobacteria bacterium SCGC AG-212-J23]